MASIFSFLKRLFQRKSKQPQRPKRPPYILAIDTDTYAMMYKDENNRTVYPPMVELACVRYDKDGNEVETYRTLVQPPKGYTIPTDSFVYNKFSRSQLEAEAVPVEEALSHFFDMLSRSGCLLGHNIQFDLYVIREYMTIDSPANWHYSDYPWIDTSSPPMCLGKEHGIKQNHITLPHLHTLLFGHPYDNPHHALSDARACARIYFEMIRQGDASWPIS